MFFSFVLTVVSWSLTAKHNRKEEGKEKCHLSQHDQKKKKTKLADKFPSIYFIYFMEVQRNFTQTENNSNIYKRITPSYLKEW